LEFGTNKILITGVNGWLGKTLIQVLSSGISSHPDLKNPPKDIKIKGLALPNENTNIIKSISSEVKIFYGDITNKQDCDHFTNDAKGAILFHCAGIIHPKRVKDFFNINVEGTKNIFESSIKNKIKKIIVISSNSPCGTNPNNEHLFDELSLYNPYLNYGKSKMIMELLVKRFVESGKIESVIIRPPWFYGPHQPNRQIRFYKMIRDGKIPIIGNGKNKRSLACTINICQGMILAAINEKVNGSTYWIADEKTYSFNEIINIVENVMEEEFNIDCKKGRLHLPSYVSDIAYLLDKGYQSLGLYNKEIHVLSEMNKTIACSIEKAKKEIGYNPTINLQKGTYMSIKSSLNQFN
jgi:nucleoside-diphosphate-sugar epimerase